MLFLGALTTFAFFNPGVAVLLREDVAQPPAGNTSAAEGDWPDPRNGNTLWTGDDLDRLENEDLKMSRVLRNLAQGETVMYTPDLGPASFQPESFDLVLLISCCSAEMSDSSELVIKQGRESLRMSGTGKSNIVLPSTVVRIEMLNPHQDHISLHCSITAIPNPLPVEASCDDPLGPDPFATATATPTTAATPTNGANNPLTATAATPTTAAASTTAANTPITATTAANSPITATTTPTTPTTATPTTPTPTTTTTAMTTTTPTTTTTTPTTTSTTTSTSTTTATTTTTTTTPTTTAPTTTTPTTASATPTTPTTTTPGSNQPKCLCAPLRRSASSRIMGGKYASPWEYPYMVSITGPRKLLGGGSVISRSWVLTGAQVLGYCSQSSLRVRAGMRGYYWEGHTYGVRQIIKHQNYKRPWFGDDVGLIKIMGRFTFADHLAPVCLPTKALCPGTVGIATGWGTASGHSAISSWLRDVALKTISAHHCRYKNSLYWRLISDKMFCGGAKGKDTCKYDGGGPLVLMEKGRAVQYGITSWGKSYGNVNYPGVYVDVADYVPWIKAHVDEAIHTLDNCKA